MTYRTLFFQSLIILFFSILPFTIIAGQQPMQSQMQDIEKEMAEANKAIEEYISSLPPAEQAEFNRQVEEFTQMFENMSDEDFEKFLGEMFNEEQIPQPDFYQAPQPIMQEEVIEVPQLNVEQLKKVETAITILNDIIKQSNMFMIIINSLPELPNRITKWGKNGMISHWQEGMTWDTLKIDLEYFIQKLYKVQEQDLTTKEYKYLLDLIADEALYNNIIQLRASLNNLLPIINIPEFGIQKISAQSKEAIINILKKYTESFYLLGLPKSLDAIFEKYEPQAKKIREAESSATRRALEASKEPRSPAEYTEAGAEQEAGYKYGGYDSYGYGDYGSPYYGGGYEGGYAPYYGGGYEGGYSPEGGLAGAGGGKSGGGGAGAGRTTGGGIEKPFEEKKEEKEKEKEKAEEFIPNAEITELIGKIKGTLETINKTISGEEYTANTPKLNEELVTHISDSVQPVNDILASLVLPIQIDKRIAELSDTIKKIDSLAKKLNSTTLNTYQKEIKKVFDKNTKELKDLKTIITRFEPQTKEEKAAAELATKTAGKEIEIPQKVDVTKLSPEKKWAYFADEDAKEALEETDEGNAFLEKIGKPISLRKIKEDIDKLFKEVKIFGEKKATKPVVKKVEKPVEKPTE